MRRAQARWLPDPAREAKLGSSSPAEEEEKEQERPWGERRGRMSATEGRATRTRLRTATVAARGAPGGGIRPPAGPLEGRTRGRPRKGCLEEHRAAQLRLAGTWLLCPSRRERREN